jgi:hypothetical protein
LNTPEKALYDRAKTLAQDGTGDCAFLFDLSRLDGIEDPILSKAATDVVDARIGETKAEAFALSGHRWMYLGSHEAIDAIESAVTALSAEMSARKLGEIRNVRFDLSRHAEQFLDQCANIAKEQADPTNEPAPSVGSTEEFIDLVKIKARLQGVDFSPMIRRRAIWRTAPERSAVRIADQIIVQNAAVKKLFGIDLDAKDWVAQKIQSLFARYLVWSQLREYRHDGRTKPPVWIPITPDLLTLPEMQSAFLEMHATAIIGTAAPEILSQAAVDGDKANIPLALVLPQDQGIPANVPDYFHFILANTPPDSADWAARWVFSGDDEDKIQAAIAQGVQHFVGSSAPDMHISDSASAGTAAPRGRRDEKPAQRRAESDDEPPPPPKSGLFTRMRSWLKPPAPTESNADQK